jgi:hypothetical protein
LDDHAHNAAHAVDGTPLMTRKVQAHEQVAREQGREDVRNLARMPYSPAVTGTEDFILQPFDIDCGLDLCIRSCMGNIPTAARGCLHVSHDS